MENAYCKINVASLAFLTALSVLLYFLRFRVPLLSDMFSLEFSAFPELIASLAYGPLYGVAVCLIKNAIHISVHPNYLITDIADFIIESVFVGIAGMLYLIKMFPKVIKSEKMFKRAYKHKSLFFGSVLGIICALAIQFITTTRFVFPVLIRKYSQSGYTGQRLIQGYTQALNTISNRLPQDIAACVPQINSVWQGVMLVNLPITFVKQFVIVVLTVILYPLLSPLLHYRFIPKQSMQLSHIPNPNDKG